MLVWYPDFVEPVSIYLHIPFCRHRCAYCDFNTYAGQESRIQAYVNALCQEIRQVSDGMAGSETGSMPVHTIFMGGGTPSLLSITQIEEIFTTIQNRFGILPDVEITIEANPGTITKAYLSELRRVGINRLSMGMQSARPDDLRLIQRQHNFSDVIQSVAWAREAGFDNLSVDVLFGIPGQTMEGWQFSLAMALALRTEHLSLYSLTIEEGTPFHRWMKKGLFSPVDEDLMADMMAYTEESMAAAGYEQYEISNWARMDPDHRYECRHNLQYWHNQPYFGFGAGAHGSLAGQRLANAASIEDYIQMIMECGRRSFPHSPATVESNLIDDSTAMQETMMVGLRLTREGVSQRRFTQRFGLGLEQAFGKEINKLIGQGLLEWSDGGETLRLTGRGRFLGNRVFIEFVGD